MGILDKLGNLFGTQIEEEENEIEKPENETLKTPNSEDKEKKPAPERPASNVLSFKPAASNDDKDSPAATQYPLSKITTIKPKDFSEVQSVADCLREQIPVIVNFEETDINEARRIIDFISGTIYAFGGKIKPISSKVFICAPDNITVSSPEDDKKNIGLF